MYEVKKHDYNTVRFLPEYNSGFGNDFQYKRNRRRKRRRVVIVLLILVILIAAGAFVAYKFFFSPRDQFIKAFENSDFTTCSQIFEENAYDSDFVSDVRPTVTDASEAVFQRYMNGELNSADASQLLSNYNNAAGDAFADDINVYTEDIAEVEALKAQYTTFQTQCSEADYDGALTTAQAILAVTENHGLDYSDEITSAVIEHFYDFKAEAFRDIADAISSRNYDTADAICTFMLGCSNDEDFTEERATIQDLRNGNARVSTEARAARRIASDAEDQAREIEQSEGVGGEDQTSPEI